MKKFKAISFSLAALLAAGSLAACGGDAQQTTDTTEVQQTSAESVSTETEVSDDLPDSLNYNGRTLRILSSLSWSGYNESFHSNQLSNDELTGDIVNDAVYKRNLTVRERFGIDMTEETQPYQNVEKLASQLIMAGDDAYDLMSTTDRTAFKYASEGMTIPTEDLKYVDLTKPYWCQSINESLTVGGKSYVAYSDMMMTVYDFTHVLLLNKDYIEQYRLDDLYDIVADGNWTFDRFGELCRIVQSDVNGDTVMDDSDRYGWLVGPKQVSPLFWISSGIQSVQKDEDDIPHFSMNNEKMLEMLQKAYDYTWGDDFWYQNEQNRTDITDPPIFADGRALFSSVTFQSLFGSYYRDLTFDYGILPYPKYDESQESYYCRVEGGMMYFVPVTASDPDFVGAMMEALSCESMKQVIPAYYETALKVKYTRDDQSMEILDMIMANRVYDLGDTIYNTKIRDGFVLSVFKEKRAVSASDIEANSAAAEELIKSTIAGLLDE